jgi:hypothetical protein
LSSAPAREAYFGHVAERAGFMRQLDLLHLIIGRCFHSFECLYLYKIDLGLDLCDFLQSGERPIELSEHAKKSPSI